MATVIVGAGIIGTSTAYYLSKELPDASAVHLIEASPDLFASASGYAAGFLACDWFSRPLAALGEKSFHLHRELAEKNDGFHKWGYSQTTSTSLAETIGNHSGADWLREGASRAEAAARTSPASGHFPSWLKSKGELDVMSDGNTTAQVDPRSLCEFLLSACLSRGVQLHQPARPICLTHSPSGTLESITILDTLSGRKSTIPCQRLVLAAGAWTPQVHRTLFPTAQQNIQVTSLAGHSIILRSSHWPPPALDPTDPVALENTVNEGKGPGCHAVFTTDAASGYSPEMFSRMPDGHIYLAGLNSSTYPLPAVANERVIDEQSIAALKKTAKKMLGDDIQVVRESVCWRPVGGKGVPIIAPLGEIGGPDGVWVAAGHGPWGISLSLGTGWCVAGMVQGRDMSRYVGQLGF